MNWIGMLRTSVFTVIEVEVCYHHVLLLSQRVLSCHFEL